MGWFADTDSTKIMHLIAVLFLALIFTFANIMATLYYNPTLFVITALLIELTYVYIIAELAQFYFGGIKRWVKKNKKKSEIIFWIIILILFFPFLVMLINLTNTIMSYFAFIALLIVNRITNLSNKIRGKK